MIIRRKRYKQQKYKKQIDQRSEKSHKIGRRLKTKQETINNSTNDLFSGSTAKTLQINTTVKYTPMSVGMKMK